MLHWLFNGMARMSAFTVHEPPQVGGTKLQRAESLLFIRDGFSWRAALLGPFYLLARGEWLALAVYAAAAAVLAAILALASAGSAQFVSMFILLNVLTGYEASEVKRWSLSRAGWVEIASVGGRGQEDAERRFFEAWLPSVPAETLGYADPAPPPHDDMASRAEASVRRLAERIRSRFAIKT